MAISEVSVKDATMMAIEEINEKGGVLGKKIEAVVEDGASDWPTFKTKAEKLLTQDKVAAVFGCWTSVSRKTVLPTFEKHNGLLWYPVQYEGMETSPNIFYTGATTNQQITPAVEWLLKNRQEEVLSTRLRLRVSAHRECRNQGAVERCRPDAGRRRIHAARAIASTRL
jgi:urea transport system substrate-binding protein